MKKNYKAKYVCEYCEFEIKSLVQPKFCLICGKNKFSEYPTHSITPVLGRNKKGTLILGKTRPMLRSR